MPKLKTKFWWSLVRFDRTLAGGPLKQLWIAIKVFAFVFGITFALFGIYAYINEEKSLGQVIAQIFVDMISPVTVRDIAYNKYNGWNVFFKSIIYFLGIIFFTGFFVATITSGIRTRSDKFKQGLTGYKFQEHIVFLGYDDMIIGMIQKLCEDEESQNNKEYRIVVGVESKASEIFDKIRNRIYSKYEDHFVVLQADSCNKSDLKRLRVPYAKKVFIIGEHDDAYNLKSYRSIYELSLCMKNFEKRMPQCYVNLRHQSTLTLFQTYATSGDIYVDFSHFHTFNFSDEWARYMIVGDGLTKKLRIDRGNIKNTKPVHLVIVGMTEMGRALARQACLLCHYPSFVTHKIRTKITFIDPQAKQHAQQLIGHYQRLFEHCQYAIYYSNGDIFEKKLDKLNVEKDLDVEFEFYEADISDFAIRKQLEEWSSDSNRLLTIAICQPSASQSMATGTYLPNNLYDTDVPIWIYQPTYGDLGHYLKGSRYKNIVTFGMSGENIDVCNEDITKKAMRINHYIKNYNNGTVEYDNNRLIDIEWQECKMYEKWEYINRIIYYTSVMQRDMDWMIDNNTELYANIGLQRNKVESLMWNTPSEGRTISLEEETKNLKEIINISKKKN